MYLAHGPLYTHVAIVSRTFYKVLTRAFDSFLEDSGFKILVYFAHGPLYTHVAIVSRTFYKVLTRAFDSFLEDSRFKILVQDDFLNSLIDSKLLGD